MNRGSWVFASLVLVGGCGAKSSGISPATPESAAAQSGTPDSVIPEGSATAGNGASASDNAFVRTQFDANAASKVEAKCGGDKLRLTLDGVLFDFDHDNLQPGADDVLAQVQKVGVDPYPTAHLVVEGHTDNVGTDAHNDDLSRRRANTVVTWLQAHGVAAARLEAKGYGKRWPRVPNTTEANRAKNRRVELIVLDEKASTACSGPAAAGDITGVLPPVKPDPGGNDKIVGEPHHGDPKGRSPTADDHPQQFPAFSFLYNDLSKDNNHTCFSYDPSWVRPNGPPMAHAKSEFSVHEGQFVDHCPTENVVATCDDRAVVPTMESYYVGITDPNLLIAKQSCVGAWRGALPAIAKLQPDPSGTYVAVCDFRQTDASNCVEYRADANATMIAVAKQTCTGPQPPRCPTQGATGRCDQSGMITLYYVSPADAARIRPICLATAGTWTQP